MYKFWVNFFFNLFQGLELSLEFLKTQIVEMPYEMTKDKDSYKSRPISSELVPCTEWHVVWTSDKRVFFHKQNEKLSVWERPEILKERVDVDELVKKIPTLTVTQNDVFRSGSQRFNSKKNSKESRPNLVRKKSPEHTSSKVQKLSEETERREVPAKISRLNKQKIAEEFLMTNKIEASKEAAVSLTNYPRSN